MQPTSGTSTIWLSLAIAVPGISLRRLWLLHPVERRKGRPGAHVAAWWSASEVLVLAGAAELPGVSRARLGCRQRAYDPRGEQEHQRLYRAWRSGHSRIIKVCPAPACQMRHRPGARDHPFTSWGHPVEERREGHVLGCCVRSLQDRAGETSWHHNRIRGLPDGWIPVTPFRSNPQP